MNNEPYIMDMMHVHCTWAYWLINKLLLHNVPNVVPNMNGFDVKQRGPRRHISSSGREFILYYLITQVYPR